MPAMVLAALPPGTCTLSASALCNSWARNSSIKVMAPLAMPWSSRNWSSTAAITSMIALPKPATSYFCGMISPNSAISESHYGTDALFASLARAARLIFDPAFAGIVVKALLLTILLFAAALALTEFGLAYLPVLGNPLVNRVLEWLAPLLFVFGGVIVGPPVAALFASLFLDQVAERIEARDYPGWPARSTSFATTLRAGLKLAALIIGVNLVLLPFDIGLPGLGELLSLAANGWLLGREYFELAALRHIALDAATEVRRANGGVIWLAGALIALASMVPLLNLVAPLFGTALMVHLFHRMRRASDA